MPRHSGVKICGENVTLDNMRLSDPRGCILGDVDMLVVMSGVQEWWPWFKWLELF
jgi:hypothetical protein